MASVLRRSRQAGRQASRFPFSLLFLQGSEILEHTETCQDNARPVSYPGTYQLHLSIHSWTHPFFPFPLSLHTSRQLLLRLSTFHQLFPFSLLLTRSSQSPGGRKLYKLAQFFFFLPNSGETIFRYIVSKVSV